ncbi:WXG100 family type VII secretion target [Kitasatospora cineracea]|uniref:WXG100 family type VII secretion target n=1 Tax=Kitasatospora cineracea TaxID=88074 RepID=UPI00367DFADF
MTTDEPAWFTTPAHTARHYPEGTVPAQPVLPDGVEPARIGTVLPDGVEPARIGTVLPDGVEPARIGTVLPDGTFPAYTARSSAEGVPAEFGERTFPAYQNRVPAAEGVPAEFGERTFPAYRAGVPASEGVPLRAADGTVPAEQVGRAASEGVLADRAGTVPGVAKETGAVPAGTTVTPRQPAGVVAKNAGSAGNAGAGFRVDPAQYLAAVSPLLAASEQVAALSSALSGYLPSLESQNPWGNDDSGKKFAEGEKGYLSYSHDTLAVLKELSGDLKTIADGLKAMGQSYQDADSAITADFGGQDQGTAPLPPAPSAPRPPVHVPMTPHLTQSGRH